MDPYTGEIYAEATYPSYDANDYTAIAAKRPAALHRPDRLDRLRAGLRVQDDDRGRGPRARARVTPRHADQGHRHAPARRRPDAKIDDADRKGDGLDDVRGRRRLLAQRRRGQGRARARQDDPRVVGDPLRHVAAARLRRADRASTSPARSAGIVRDPALKPWRQIDLANGAFGQGVAVTPIQLATAYAALMNGGSLVQPHVVKAIGERGDRRRAPRAKVIDQQPVDAR